MIGFIFECGPQGADKQVCEYLATEITGHTHFKSRTLDNKPKLLSDAGPVARQLLGDGCCCVLIVWDLRPSWPDKKDKPCRKMERDAVLKSLHDADVPHNAPVYLVCIEQELESWILAARDSLSAYLSTAAHPYVAPRMRRPDDEKNPKSKVISIFRKERGLTYDDKVHALKILRAAPVKLPRLRDSLSFARFEEKLRRCC
ncbi:MAG TPA: DUF4276 family protein [Casimicrobium sp.]|nr:DUF4276 family protein [Casimicrobium sp.]